MIQLRLGNTEAELSKGRKLANVELASRIYSKC